MPTTNATLASGRNRNPRAFSFEFPHAEERRRDSLLRAAWLRIIAGFDCRPAPRGPWDETASGDQTPWKYVVGPIRNAIASAQFSQNEQLLEQTVEAACAWCDELKADFRSMVQEREEESTVAVALDETHVEGPANEVEARFIAQPSPTTAEAAVQPLERQYERLGKLIAGCRRMARSRSQMVPLNGGVK
jgi:hypothetical protein